MDVGIPPNFEMTETAKDILSFSLSNFLKVGRQQNYLIEKLVDMKDDHLQFFIWSDGNSTPCSSICQFAKKLFYKFDHLHPNLLIY